MTEIEKIQNQIKELENKLKVLKESATDYSGKWIISRDSYLGTTIGKVRKSKRISDTSLYSLEFYVDLRIADEVIDFEEGECWDFYEKEIEVFSSISELIEAAATELKKYLNKYLLKYEGNSR